MDGHLAGKAVCCGCVEERIDVSLEIREDGLVLDAVGVAQP
jgi:hypothetical protein